MLNSSVPDGIKHILNKLLIICLSLCCLLVLPTSVNASPLSIDSKEFSAKVLKIIQDNPETLYQVMQNYYQREIEEQNEERVSLLKELKNSKELIENSPIQGAKKVILIEFSDFQCPYCAEAHDTLQQFILKHQNMVALVYKHYPIFQIHKQAMSAAAASWAAYQQNKFWHYHNYLFTHQDQLGEDLYIQAAKYLGLDLAKFEQDRKSQEATAAIQKDMELAKKIGVSGTPFFVMGEDTFSGAVTISFLEDKLSKLN
jgi:protein-disulfide isomerase